ncbi:MAG: hypothetical protein Q9P14_09365, partial [candidate division KSB1 bacterium]|nr:hypothetical protein [candidate division KSB1 bacterium]
MDMAQFRVNDSISLAEIYFAIPRNQFTFAASDSALRADLNLAIDIYKNDQHVLRRAWQATSYASDVQGCPVRQDAVFCGQFSNEKRRRLSDRRLDYR